MELTLLNDMTVIFGLAIGVALVCHRLRVPTLVGFILTGVLAGPHGLKLVKGVHEVEVLAEVGVVMLLFTIGIEFSLERLAHIRKAAFLGGSLQMLLTFTATYLLLVHRWMPQAEAVFTGFLVSLSSTAIVMKLLQQRAEVDSPHGKIKLGVLIFQDMMIVPLMLFTPLLAGEGGRPGAMLLLLLAKGAGLVILVLALANWVVPRLLYEVARLRSRELFLMSIVLVCLGVTWLTTKAGLSLALGAFLAGLIISESAYTHQALGHMLPFRDVFISFFFVSIGMLLDVGFFLQRPLLILALSAGVMLLKTLTATAAVLLLRYPPRTALLAGLGLCQIGEFSFILSKSGIEHGLLTPETNQFFIAVSLLTMAATTVVVLAGPRLSDWAMRLPLSDKIVASDAGEALPAQKMDDHLVIVGFGVNGRNLARAARAAGIPYVAIELNPDTVAVEKAAGEPILYGDATQEAVLELAGARDARAAAVAVSDPVATRRITEIIRRTNPRVYLIVRTRYVGEIEPLLRLGADEVVPEEFETSVEIFTRVLWKYLVPKEEIEKFIAEIRQDGYEMFRSMSRKSAGLADLRLHSANAEISTLRVHAQSAVAGKSLQALGLRKTHGVTVLAIRREQDLIPNPDAQATIRAGDVVVVLGSPERLSAVAPLFGPGG